jgi:hypothetical protein
MTQEGEIVLVALPTIEDNPMTVSLAKATNGAVLCVLMGEMKSSNAKRTVDKIGPNQFVGSIVLHRDEGHAPGFRP